MVLRCTLLMDEAGASSHGLAMRLSRLTAFGFCLILTAAGLGFGLWLHESWAWWLAGVCGLLSLLGVHDSLQPHHSILRNYPVIGHIRWLAELVRPELRQYLFEADQ